MKIVCTKEEFAELIRACDRFMNDHACIACPLMCQCGMDKRLETALKFEITD